MNTTIKAMQDLMQQPVKTQEVNQIAYTIMQSRNNRVEYKIKTYGYSKESYTTLAKAKAHLNSRNRLTKLVLVLAHRLIDTLSKQI